MVTVGDRVWIEGSIKDSATVRYYGPTKFASGEWVGLELDNKVGKNNGTIDGIKYFDPMNHSDDGLHHGLFTRVDNVKPLLEPNPDIGAMDQFNQQYLTLQEKFNQSTQYYEDQMEQLQKTIDSLTLKDTDLRDKLSQLTAESKLVKNENNEMKAKIVILEDQLKNGLNVTIEPQLNYEKMSLESLIQENKSLRQMVIALENSSNDIIQQYEESLNHNTELLQHNIDFQGKIDKLNLEDEQNKSTILELKEKFEAREDSEDVINYLTESNNNLLTEVSQLKEKILDYEQTMKTIDKDKYNQHDLELKLQEQLDTLRQELNINNLLLEEEYEKNITLTEKLQQLKKTIYKDQQDTIGVLQNKIIQLERSLDLMKYYKQFGEFYMNNDTKLLDVVPTQIQLLKTFTQCADDKLITSNEELFTELFFDIVRRFVSCINNSAISIEEDLLTLFFDKIFKMRKWKDSLFKHNINIKDYDIKSLMEIIPRTLGNDMSFLQMIANDIMKNIFPGILEILKDTIASTAISNYYKIILNIEESITQLSCQDKRDINLFISLVKQLFGMLEEDKYEKFPELLNGMENYLREVDSNEGERAVVSNPEEEIEEEKAEDLDNTTKDNTAKPSLETELINELKIKLDILSNKAQDYKIKENINIQLKENIQDLTLKLVENRVKLEECDNQMINMKNELGMMKLDSLQLIKDKKLTSSLLEHDEVDKVELMSEVYYLRNDLLNKMNIFNYKNGGAKGQKNDKLEWLINDEREYGMKHYHKENLSTTHHKDMDRLLNSLAKLIENCMGSEANDKLERYDNIVKHVITELTM